MLRTGLNVGIGTDGPASNNDLDMFEEMRLAAFWPRAISGDPTALPARQALAMATRLGAQALHMGDLTGSLEPGKRADLILVDSDAAAQLAPLPPRPDAIYAQLVYAAKATDVTDVMVNGRWLMRDRAADARRGRPGRRGPGIRQADRRLPDRPASRSCSQKLVAIGGAERGGELRGAGQGALADPADRCWP